MSEDQELPPLPAGAQPAPQPGQLAAPEPEAEPAPDGSLGIVFLVGAGPGDPGLLTVRGRELLEKADVVVYDRLANAELLHHCPPGCLRLAVGKAPGAPERSQQEINRMLVEHAARGARVVRLKGGDPFVFGRGGEEALALTAMGIPFEVVPGVSSALAVPAYAGIPVTHRDLASSVAVITGHERPGRQRAAVDWSAFGRQPDTLVVLMARSTCAEIVQALIAAGRPAATPAAVIQWGTTGRQRTVVSELGEIAAASAEMDNPAVLVIGEVVRLREQLGWFEHRPLFGRRVLLTRTREQASELASLLRVLGAEPVELPVLRIQPETEGPELDAAIAELGAVLWVCFTSANAVGPLFGALQRQGLDARALAGCRLAAVGPATARALAEHGLRADVVPPRASAQDLVEAMRTEVYPGQRILFVRGEPSSEALAAGLQGLGLDVRQVVAYRALPDPEAQAAALEMVETGVDAVTFASSATVGHFLNAAGAPGRRLCEDSRVVCIGPQTARAAEALGLRVDRVAEQASASGLLQALLALWEGGA